MLVVYGVVFVIGDAALAEAAWIALGVVTMLFGGAIAYVVSQGRSPRYEAAGSPRHLVRLPDAAGASRHTA